jgi:hypothetical protein
MSETEPPAEPPPLGPREALVQIRTLVRAALQSDDLETVQKLLKEMRDLVDNAIPPHRRRNNRAERHRSF